MAELASNGMRIGLDARFFGPLETGIGRYVERLVAHLAVIDQRNEYVVFLRRRGYDWWQPPNSRWRKVLADYHWYGLAEQRAMPGIFRRARLDLLHVPHFNVPLLTRGPFVVTIHDLILDEFPTERATTLEPLLFALKFRAYQAVVRHAIRHSRAIMTVSEHSKRQLVERFRIPAGKVTVTYESVDSLPEAVPFESLAERGVRRLSPAQSRFRVVSFAWQSPAAVPGPRRPDRVEAPITSFVGNVTLNFGCSVSSLP